MTDDVGAVLSAVQRSGFPLQARIEHEIRARPAWAVLADEYPWFDLDKNEYFVDVVASCRSVVLIIDCKKMQERALVFMRHIGHEISDPVLEATAWRRKNKGEPWSQELLETKDLEPRSYRSQFCVTTENDKARQRLLEPDARVVALAAETLAGVDYHAVIPKMSLLVPVIVTTARLYTISFEPGEISLATGELSEPLDRKHEERIETIPWVRFHKTLGVGSAQTVFVVSSASLPAFLDAVARGQGSRFAFT
jgi:hypothetical protein